MTLWEDKCGPEPQRSRCTPHPSGVGGPFKTLEDQFALVRIEVHER